MPAAAASTRAGVRPAGHERQTGVGSQQQPEPLGRLVASGQRIRRDAAQRDAGARVGEVDRPEDEGGQPVGDLDLTVGERRPGLAGQQPEGALAGERCAGSKPRQDLARGERVVGQQGRGQARTRELTGDVVVQVGVQATESGVELGSRAQGQDEAVERVQPEAVRGEDERRRRRRLSWIRGKRDGLLVGDIEPAQCVVRIGAAGDRRLHGGAQARVEEGKQLVRSRGRHLLPRARERRRAARR